jgi:excisionase family DNA binding protein
MPKTNVAIAAQSGEIHWTQRPLLPIKTVAELLGVSRSGIYRLEAAEKLAFGKIGGRTVVRVDSVLRYLEEVEDWTSSQQGAAGRKAAAEQAAQGWQ